MAKAEYWAAIPMDQLRRLAEHNLIAVLDMLRYDAVRVDEVSTSWLVLRAPNHHVTAERWRSFGIYGIQVASSRYELQYCISEAMEKSHV